MAEILTGQGLRNWLSDLASHHTLIAPRAAGGRSYFQPVSRVDEIDFGYGQSTVPPKEWFFPRTDALFTVDVDRPEIRLPAAPGPRIIFGIRPCDAKALAVLDKLFLMEPADGLYEARRRETALIGLACGKQQMAECFCTSLGGGPRDESHVDVLLVEAEGGYDVQAATERGRELLSGAAMAEGGTVPPAPSFRGEIPTAGARERIRSLFNAEYWERLADRCIGCRMCSFVCPTCHCFDVRDYRSEGQMERSRCWDGCQSSHFTKLAGGHNPRHSKTARLRQFYAHKYVYFPERFGVTQCVGCGRCAHYCPVNIDIRETLRDLQLLEEV
jgi:sulfhydrogenase subunit beta (sulfur reductase)